MLYALTQANNFSLQFVTILQQSMADNSFVTQLYGTERQTVYSSIALLILPIYTNRRCSLYIFKQFL